MTSLDFPCHDPIFIFKNVVSLRFDRPSNGKVIELTPEWLSKLSQMEKLTKLHLDACTLHIERFSTRSPAHFDTLESLTLSTSLAALSQLSRILHCARLSHLEIHIDTNPSNTINWWETAASVRRLIHTTWKSLEKVEITGLPGPQEESWGSRHVDFIRSPQPPPSTAELRNLSTEEMYGVPIYGALYSLHRASLYKGFDQNRSGIILFSEDKNTSEDKDKHGQTKRWKIVLDYRGNVKFDESSYIAGNMCSGDGEILVYHSTSSVGSYQCTIMGDHRKSSLYLTHFLELK